MLEDIKLVDQIYYLAELRLRDGEKPSQEASFGHGTVHDY